jgi:hypothetical protein
MLGGLMKKLFGGSSGGGDDNAGGDKPLGDPVEHKGCMIQPIAMHKGGQFLTAGIISKEFPDGPRAHRFVRADTHSAADTAHDFAIIKGRQIIDEQGDRLFDRAA